MKLGRGLLLSAHQRKRCLFLRFITFESSSLTTNLTFCFLTNTPLHTCSQCTLITQLFNHYGLVLFALPVVFLHQKSEVFFLDCYPSTFSLELINLLENHEHVLKTLLYQHKRIHRITSSSIHYYERRK